MLAQLAILLLSAVSMTYVTALLRAPWLPEQRPVRAPLVIAPVIDEGYFDTRGLV